MALELTLHRERLTDEATVGRLVVGSSSLVVFTLEDAVRPFGVKIAGQTAIPPGRYRVVVRLSERFGCELPRLLDVPLFRGVLIHAGNTVEHTRGCILVGRAVDYRAHPARLIDSKRALADVIAALRAHGGEAWIHIHNPPAGAAEAA